MIRALFIIAFVLVTASCERSPDGVFQGYAEGEFVRVAAPFAANLQALNVRRGMLVNAGEPLFALEQVNETAARREAQERARNAEAQLADLKKSKRPSEIEIGRAHV